MLINTNDENITCSLIFPPGLEEALDIELSRCDLGEYSLLKMKGGYEVTIQKKYLNQLHQLRSITKIHLHLARFKATNLAEIFNKTKKIKWNKFLLNMKYEFNLSSKRSRIIAGKNLENTLIEAITEYQASQPLAKKYSEVKSSHIWKIGVNIEDNIVQIYINTAKNNFLYKRTPNKYIGLAPIRENIASACLILVSKYCDIPSRLTDPMCGSATLLLEASRFPSKIEQKHPYQIWDWFSPTHPKIHLQNIFIKFNGYDKDNKTIEAARKNATQLGVIDIELKKSDLFKDSFDHTDVVISNLPYNQRIKTDRARFYKNVFDTIKEKYNPNVIALIMPKGVTDQIPTTPTKSYHFRNGGISVEFNIWKMKKN